MTIRYYNILIWKVISCMYLLRHESIQSLGIISQLYPHLIMESVVPKLLTQLSSGMCVLYNSE